MEAPRTDESRFRRLVETASVGINIGDFDGGLNYMNPSLLKLLGYSAEEVEAGLVRWSDLTPSDCAQADARAMQQLLRHGTCEPYEKAYIARDGRRIPLLFGASLIPNATGTSTEVACFITDLTELKQTDEALRWSEEQYRLILQSTRDCIKVLDLDGRLLSLNKEGQQQLGIEDFDSVRNKCWLDFWEGAHRDAAQLAFRDALAGGEGRFEGHFPKNSGESTWWDVAVTPLRDPAGRIVRLLSVSRDITARKSAKLALERTKAEVQGQWAELESIYKSAPVGLSLFTPDDFRYLRVNDVLSTILGCSPEDVLGRTISEVIPAIAPIVEPLFREVAKGASVKNFQLEGELPSQPGVHRYWNVNYSPVLAPDDSVRAISAVVQEITSQKRAERALIQAEKLAAVGRLASSISHEINNPLEAVTNLLYLSLQGEMADNVRGYLEMAQAEVRRVSEIATQTLRFHKQSTRANSVVISSLMDSVLTLYAGRLSNFAIRLERRYQDRDPIHCFEGELRQVFNNLIGNAIDAMHGGGRLVIRTAPAYEAQSGRPGVRVVVADTGHGMDRQTQQNLFQAFYTTKGLTGTGLGLWISKDILDRHKATIRLRTRQHASKAGTVFSLFLPSVCGDWQANNRLHPSMM